MNNPNSNSATPSQRLVTVTLNPGGVVAPAEMAARDAIGMVAIALAAIAAADLSQSPQIPGVFFQPTWVDRRSPDVLRGAYTNWVLGKAFHEIARGVRLAMEEAFLYLAVLSKASELKVGGEFNQLTKRTKTRANKLNFPDLLSAVNLGLVSPLQFADEFRSLQAVRNCLEHGNGVVREQDVAESGALTLTLPCVRIFLNQGGQETDLSPGMRLEKGEVVSVGVGRLTRSYVQGERIVFSAEEFSQIAGAILFFASDLRGKLPVQIPNVNP